MSAACHLPQATHVRTRTHAARVRKRAPPPLRVSSGEGTGTSNEDAPTNAKTTTASAAAADILSNKTRPFAFYWPETPASFAKALELGLTNVAIVDADEPKSAKAEANASAMRALAAGVRILKSKHGKLIDENKVIVGTFFDVSNGEKARSAEKAVGSASAHNIFILDPGATGWASIVSENIVAAAQQNSSCRPTLVGVAYDRASATAMLDALEMGLDGIIVKTENISDLAAIAADVAARCDGQVDNKQRASDQGTLAAARVTAITPLGMGHRVCADLCTEMRDGEGLLVGNHNGSYLLVHSECAENDFVASRPFRVNAGSTHMYVYDPVDDKTRYLSELRTGGIVRVVNATRGTTSRAFVGRAKVERRPLVLVEASFESSGRPVSIVLQNAETVRLMRCNNAKEGTTYQGAVSVAALRVGDALLGWEDATDSGGKLLGGRHVGVRIDEFLEER